MVELSFAGEVAPGLDIAASYTTLDAEDKATGVPLKRRPDRSGSLSLNYNWQERLNFNLKTLWVDERPDLDPDLFTDITTDGYTRFDFAGSYRAWDWLTPYLRIENLLDKDYEEAAGFPAPGRILIAGLRFRSPE